MGAGASNEQSVKVQHSAEYNRHHSNVANWSKSKHPMSPTRPPAVKVNPLTKNKDGVWEIRAAGEMLTGKWDPYPVDINERLETALKDGKEECQIVVHGKLQTVHFKSMTQKGHGGSREVRRVLKDEDGSLITPEKSKMSDPFAFQESDSMALFASPSTSTYAGDDLVGGGGAGADGHVHPGSRYKAVLHSTIQAHSAAVYGINFSVDGDKIITGSKDGTCKYWESSTSYLVSSFATHPGAVLSTVLNKGSSIAATGCDDDKARIFDLKRTGNDVEPVLTLEGHTHKVYALNFLDAHTLLTGSMDNDLRLWDVNKGTCNRTVTAHDSSVFYTSVSQRSGKNLVLSASDDCTMCQHDFREKDSIVARFTGHDKTLWGCDIRFDDGQYVSCGMDAKVMLWDPRNPSTPTDTFSVHKSPIHSVEYLPDGTGILSAARDHSFKIIECTKGETVLSMAAHDGNVFRASYNPISNLVMTCGTDTKVKLWSLENH